MAEEANPKAAFGTVKWRWSDVPMTVMPLIAAAFRLGVLKYGWLNFRATKVEAKTYVDAIHRHLWLWSHGENFDEEGTHHLAHVIACSIILLESWLLGRLIDNRPALKESSLARLKALASGETSKIETIGTDFLKRHGKSRVPEPWAAPIPEDEFVSDQKAADGGDDWSKGVWVIVRKALDSRRGEKVFCGVRNGKFRWDRDDRLFSRYASQEQAEAMMATLNNRLHRPRLYVKEV